MKKYKIFLYIFSIFIFKTLAFFDSLSGLINNKAIYKELDSTTKRDDVRNFISTTLNRVFSASKFCFITDSLYGIEIFHDPLTSSLEGKSVFILRIFDQESFEQEPSERVIKMLNVMKTENCEYYIILIANGIQMVSFLKFADHRRLLNSRANFIMLHDYRLFTRDAHYMWKRMINVIFIRSYESRERHRNWYEISTVPFPTEIRNNIFVSRILNYFIPPNRYLKKTDLFDERKSENLNSSVLYAVVYAHSPATFRISKDNETTTSYDGLEISLIETIADKMNFKVEYFETENSDEEKWGEYVSDGNYTGLLNVMNEAGADFALADLFQTIYHMEVMDLTSPYTSECLTFITPEVLTDNSWQALILPFSLGMWIGTLVSLICIILVFYGFSNFYRFVKNENYRTQTPIYGNNKILKKDVFDSFSACVIYSYSMILLVSIPKLPDRWSVRLLAGWWWLYCVLLIVAYRASLTSILANPQPKLTIDSLKMLAESKLKCGMWGEQNKKFFLMSSDPVAEKIGSNLERINVPEEGIAKVEEGKFAYFESRIELRRLRFEHEKKQNNRLFQTLHIMDECVINMPISIGLDKNSPLKRKIDDLILYAVEGGLINKWFNDAIKSFESSIEEAPAEALMDLKKFYGALVALLIGYIISFLAFIFEMLHWNYFIKRNPNYDKYYKRIITDCQLEMIKIENRRKIRRKNHLNGRQVTLFVHSH